MNILNSEKVVYKALEELDKAFFALGVNHIELNVVGGFALILHGIRYSDYTDIDYIGADLPINLREIVDDIGIRHGLGRGWVNSDVLLAGSNLEELEAITGKLVFLHAFDLKVITINVLDKRCLLRMKVLAVDTSFSGMGSGNEFDRFKDFEDIYLLMEHLGMSMNDLVRETFEYVLSPEIFHLIRYYVNTKDPGIFLNGKWKLIIENKGEL